MPDGPGTWKEQGVHVLHALAALSEAHEVCAREIEALRRLVYKVLLLAAVGGMLGKSALEWLF